MRLRLFNAGSPPAPPGARTINSSSPNSALRTDTAEAVTEFDNMIHLPVNDPLATVITGVDMTYVDNPFLSEMKEMPEE